MSRQAQQTARRMAMLATAVAGVGTALATNLVRRGLESVDEQTKLAR